MDWLSDLFWGDGVAHTVLLFAAVIALGIPLGKIKVFGISLGITFVLFVGILLGHFGFKVNHEILHFMKEFGLILFVYSIGLQVGPGFFSSFKKGGITLNMLAMGIVLLGVITTIILHYTTGISMQTLVGILSGAVTNTPGLGAAQQAYFDLKGVGDSTIAMGYAVAYPLAVVGIIFSIMTLRYVFKVNLAKETELLNNSSQKAEQIELISLEVNNPAIYGKTIAEAHRLIDRKFVISRVLHQKDGRIEIASSQSLLNENDKIYLATTPANKETVIALLGRVIEMDKAEWDLLSTHLVSRRILITKSNINGRSILHLNLRNNYGVNITRVNRSGVDLIAESGLSLQLGDRVTVVGDENAIKSVERVLGNQMKRLNEPNLIPIFIGIFLGVLLGSIPFAFPGIPQPVKLGLAGGPLIVAILISIFGPKYHLVTYTTLSANLMLREIGICLFLACVGLGAGENFVSTIVNDGGWSWIGYGLIITLVPLLIIGIIGRSVFKINYYTLMGLLAGSTTDPPALAYSNAAAGNDAPAVSYATVYPFTMFLRVLTAQLLILVFC
ncbi:MAG: Aspartate/alanine antiporter [Candidatus Ordinivivax streblomastigis]|uniref:Aspartate/alanine antiporter n=1 Tax=Candidatus Ordinivivax streblomastigis TaxID=2540710 RepID=A0A5M8P542_9BACT|nr:MAG: Aspartate/alanine antiporter [Candidatus Ordinivivax streblomastigis]